MKSRPKDLAFASVSFGPSGEYYGQDGLTKREYFAAMAMQGILATQSTALSTADFIARKSLEMADALIEELNKDEN